ncbi:hypothetical protein GCM10007425_29110 [Lysinibacillus alkalisoli]|uniref:HTH cro/C1-type domain-containing protein n=1 Tax=Lysinibacillus alkalisoli TaxID=1911548 RepID=A0A917LJ73_9BACI|nr:helix-turn-helix transcriptional regulator [Lysinibacillus alkalisoli]GGG32623.1 hypothetical protein GCM10007425_29110 [Lysinibacillus alkalisoli]
MNNRIKALRKNLNLNQGEFADKLKLSRSHISSLENGVREITERIVFDICREFNVNEEWLRTGEGEMFVQSNTFSLDEKAKQHNLTELEIDIMRGYMELPTDTRNNLMGLLGAIYNKHSETAISTEVDPTEVEVEAFRQEIKAEKKGKTLLALDERDRESS